jgi:hypothetical protein
MQISIAERLKPFCHLPGTSTILPGWGYQIQVFPCFIRIYQLKKAVPVLVAELNLELRGPIQQFTICNDLEKGRVTVSGKTADGWMRYHLMSFRKQEGIRLLLERTPLDGLSITQEKKRHLVREKEWLDVIGENASDELYQLPSCERLSLGNHKAQDWELIKRRLSLAEILPVWHRLGQLVPQVKTQGSLEGTLSLLEACRRSFTEDGPGNAQQHWLNVIQGGFSSLCVPRLEDNDYQGLILPKSLVSLDISPLVLLSEGAHLIRQLFVQQEKDTIAILPYLLPSLHCGRLLDVPLEGGGSLSFEWTKKTIRRLILYVEQDQELLLKFRSSIRSYRFRQHAGEKGERKNCQSSLFLKKNCHYFFDNFK